MFQKIKKQLVTVSKVAGLTIELKGNDLLHWNMIILEKQQDSIEIISRITTKIGLKNLSSIIGKKLPLTINIIGKGIIHKPIAPFPTSPENAFMQALPNASTADFVYQIDASDSVYWISIIRKKVLEDILEIVQKQGFHIVGLSIGIMGLRHILPLIDTRQGELEVGQYHLQIQEQEIQQLAKLPSPARGAIIVANEPLDRVLLSSFAIAFQVLVAIPILIFNTHSIKQARQNYFYHQLFKLLGGSFLIALFLVLLVNFAAFAWLNQQNQRLNTSLTYQQNQLAQLDSLKQRYENKQAFFQQNNVLKASRIAYYMDRIGQSIPQGVQLTNMSIFPPKGKNKREQKTAFQFHHYVISMAGISQKSVYLNQWIKILEQLKWVEQVKVLPYSEQAEGFGEFELEILLNP